MASAPMHRGSSGMVLSRLTKTFRQRGRAPVHAVAGIDLTVDEGEMLGLLGPSGCGKSTTLRMIAGLEEPTSGDIGVGGRSIVGLPPHERNVAVAFENYALFPPLTVEENITFGMRARKERDAVARAREVAERLGISPLLDRKPGGLSSGQKQRVSLARAIVRTPSVLLLDEPLSHLDAAERDATRRELKRLQRETGFTTVLVTHDQHEALSLADRIAVMNDGKLQQVGTADEVYDRPANLFVADFVGEPRMNLLPGRLSDRGNGELEVRLSDQARVALPGIVAGEANQREVMLGIRPQDLRLEPPDAPGALAATVFAFEPLQEVGRLTAQLPGVEQRVVIETHHDVRARSGEAVGLYLDPERTHLFDRETGERLEWESVPSMVAR
ncbi:MAG: ABC transporter ATP-binding protein [Thermomicrobiales bacterium]|nr:ABC transporter ATP-binding protein [Thermomicrobiales bacterium]